MQIAAAPTPARIVAASRTPLWRPPLGVSGYVARRASAAVSTWEQTGVRVRAVADAGDPTVPEPGGRVVVVGDPEQWMSRPRLLERVRTGALVIDAGCGRDLRGLTGDRDLPPYADPARGRAWEVAAGGELRRVRVLPERDS